ncbi:fibronectin type III domain-containing protein [Streptomyces sp. NPDC026659]|uniref:fibronectin type III domain-containing protein n=1 Tax=Streptomyces sp. NPDC026659 TaxID=3155123 RepID=UPI0033E66D72
MRALHRSAAGRQHGTGSRRALADHLVVFLLTLAMAVTGSALSAGPASAAEAGAQDAGAACASHATSFGAVANAPAMTLRMGCAGDAGSLRTLAQSDSDLVLAFDFNVPERRDETRALAQDAVAAVQADQNSGHTLAQALYDHARDHAVGLYPVTDAGDYDGRVTTAGDSVVLVLPIGEIGTSATWWQKFIATGVGWAVSIGASAICGALMAPGAPFAAPICLGVGGAMGGFITELMNAAFDNVSFGDTDTWASLLGAAFWGAVQGAASGYLVKWASDATGTFVTDLQLSLRGIAAKLGNLGNPLTYISDRLTDMVPALIRRLNDLQRGVGGTGAPLRVMVVGDSMTQGYEGDWTWRYRLWKWFHDQHVAVDFVGPYKGTKAQAQPQPPARPPLQGETPGPSLDAPDTSGGYAAGVDPAFDSDHFGVWGRQAMQDKKLIRGMVAQYNPDLILVGLGFNDMGWFVSGPQGTLDSMKTFVDEARAARPDVKFAVADVPQRSHIGGRDDLPISTTDYDLMLRQAVPQWSTPVSPVELVNWSGNYSCAPDSCPAGYDGLHPNALGEFQIAHAFETTLHDRYGIGQSVPAVPPSVPERPLDVARNVSAVSSDLGVTVTWDRVYGARGYTVRSRLVGATAWNETPVQANRYDTTWTADGWEWEYSVRVDNAGDGISAWSPVIRATAHPHTAAPPTHVLTAATLDGIDISWEAATGPYSDTVDRYEILTWDKDTPGAFLNSTAVRGTSAHISGLIPGHHYLVAVDTWNAVGGGLPTGARPVTIGAGTPPVPTDLRIQSVDAVTVQLNWSGSPQAAGYRVWYRNRTENGPWLSDEYISDTPERGVTFLFPGSWNFEFAVTAVNGQMESARSGAVSVPAPPSTGGGTGAPGTSGASRKAVRAGGDSGPDAGQDLALLRKAPTATLGSVPTARPHA